MAKGPRFDLFFFPERVLPVWTGDRAFITAKVKTRTADRCVIAG
jgi:hypothetical protein